MATRVSIKKLLITMGFKSSHAERVLDLYVKKYGGTDFNIEIITAMIVQLQKKDRAKDKHMKPFHTLKMTFERASQLKVNDKIDHMDFLGRYQMAKIIAKVGDSCKIHYDDVPKKWDTWSSCSAELFRFAECGSISRRLAHRLKYVKKGDTILVKLRDRGWKSGKITRFDGHSGQVQVCIGNTRKSWVHMDDVTRVKAVVKPDRKRRLDDSIHNYNDGAPQKKQKLNAKKQNEEMSKKLSLYQGKSDVVHTLNLEQLNSLENELQNGMTVIKEARERLLENKLLCVICLTNSKNIVMQPCGHLDVCNQCETQLSPKTCPRCQRPFTNCVAIRE
eukprot:115505_1